MAKTPLAFRYDEKNDGQVKKAIQMLQKCERSHYFNRSFSEIIKMIFLSGFRREIAKYLPKTTIKKLKLN